jgi:acetate kinase
MTILVLNVGSSSLKFALFRRQDERVVRLASGVAAKLGRAAQVAWTGGGKESVALRDHAEAAAHVTRELAGRVPDAMGALDAIGHRVVHGGSRLSSPVRIDAGALRRIESLAPLAPLHQSAAVAVIKALRRKLFKVPAYAVFDTAFFRDLPAASQRYAIPSAVAKKHGIRRYGFHGIAHRSLLQGYLESSGADPRTARVITFQLGQGCSAAAIRGGSPVDTSMGFTPLEGLIMGTRPGDVDAGVILYLLRRAGLSPKRLDDMLNHRSGLLGLSGSSADMARLLELEREGDPVAAVAVSAFCERARKYLGAYLAALGGAEAVVFGGGIGEHSPEIRKRICAGMEWAGLVLDPAANDSAVAASKRISDDQSRIAAFAIQTDEEAAVAEDVFACRSRGAAC